MAMRVAGDEESDGDGNEGGGQATATRVKVLRVTSCVAKFFVPAGTY